MRKPGADVRSGDQARGEDMAASSLYGRVTGASMTPPMPSGRSGELSSLIPTAIHLPKETESLTRPLALFREKHIRLAKEEQIIQYMKEYPESSPNSRKLSASLLWIFLSNGANHESDIMYDPARASWYVYGAHWCEQNDDLLQLTSLVQTSFLKCVQLAKGIATSRNIFKNLADRSLHPRRKYLAELEEELSDSDRVSKLAQNARPYFARTMDMDGNPMLLQLQNATVNLATNTIQTSRPSDFISKISTITVPEYALPGTDNPTEPPSAREDREWVWGFLWSIFKPGGDGKAHPLDNFGKLGSQDERNFFFFMCLLARLLEGRPLERTVFLYSPRGRNSKKPIEIFIRNLLGTYCQLCKHSIFTPDKANDESNSAISLSREGVRCLFGQEIDTDLPWCNAVFKRRADCGREGGAKKNSNIFREYDPVYTIVFGCNHPPQFQRCPGNSEEDRALVIYLPNKFCDSVEMRRKPISPRRFEKLDIKKRVERPESAWALLQILLHVRRNNPNLDQILSDGTCTSRD